VEILEGATHLLTGGGWSEEAMLKHLTERTTSWIAAISSGRTAAIKP
jgi:hypothetical protein